MDDEYSELALQKLLLYSKGEVTQILQKLEKSVWALKHSWDDDYAISREEVVELIRKQIKEIHD